MTYFIQTQLLRFLVTCLFYVVMLQVNRAQSIWGLRNHDISVKRLIKPLNPLPDSIKTYRIVSEMTSNPRITGMNKSVLERAFAFEFYEERLFDADLILSVTVNGFTEKSELKLDSRTVYRRNPATTSVDSLKSKSALKSNVSPQLRDSIETYYLYETAIIPQVQITVKDKFGRLLFSEKNNQITFYNAPAARSEKEAKIRLDLSKKQGDYTQKILEAYARTIQALSNNVKNRYDYQSEVIRFYVPKGQDPLFLKNIQAIKQSLQMVGTETPKTVILAALKPSIDFFEQEMYQNRKGSKKEKRRYYASALNLAHIYRCLEDFDTALVYMRFLINDDYKYCVSHTAHLVRVKARFENYQCFKETGISLNEKHRKMERNADSICLEALRNNPKAEGYIVLREKNQRIDGSILDIIKNFKMNKVILKYGKTLNDVQNHDYALADVQEIHTNEWHFAIVPYKRVIGTRVYLTQILFQTPQLILCRALNGMHVIDNRTGMGELLTLDKDTEILEFIKKSDESEFVNLHDGILPPFDYKLARYLKDCETVSRQASYRYYTKDQLLEAVTDYDSLCSSKQRQPMNGVGNQPSTATSKGSSIYLGLSTGMNNFNSALGLTASVRLKEKLFARFGAGVGGWGQKFSIGIKYDLKRDMRYTKGWSFAIGYSHNTQPNWYDSSVRPLSADAINLSTIYTKFRGRKKSFYVEVGYSIPLQQQPWIVLNPIDQYEIASLRLGQPGGLIIGLGFNFGVK